MYVVHLCAGLCNEIHMNFYLHYLEIVFFSLLLVIAGTERMNEIKHSNEMKFYCLLTRHCFGIQKHSSCCGKRKTIHFKCTVEMITYKIDSIENKTKKKVDSISLSTFCIYDSDMNKNDNDRWMSLSFKADISNFVVYWIVCVSSF